MKVRLNYMKSVKYLVKLKLSAGKVIPARAASFL